MKKFKVFKFNKYDFNFDTQTLQLHYAYDDQLTFTEILKWNMPFVTRPDQALLDQALRQVHLTLGISYFKAYVAPNIEQPYALSDGQANFYNQLYKNGLGEFLYVNNLAFDDIASFTGGAAVQPPSGSTVARGGAIVPMSGGKDSLLTAEILQSSGTSFSPVFMTTDGTFPDVISRYGDPILITRTIDPQLFAENESGAYNGHVPFSAILGALLTLSSLLYGKQDIVLSQESSADEATTSYQGVMINHQYSKSSVFEAALSDYITNNISLNLNYFSLLRSVSEKDIHRLFVASGLYDRLAGQWSSCNRANYMQGHDTSKLIWCGQCSKCVNAFLMFAPFLPKQKLLNLFAGKNLATDQSLEHFFNKLLGATDTKPFECVAETNEIRASVRNAVDSGEWDELKPYVMADKPIEHTETTANIPSEYLSKLNQFQKKYQA